MENKQVQIKIADNFPGGKYANALQVFNNKDEFVMNFMNIIGVNGRVCAKVIVIPGHMKRMINAMQDNLKKYEDKFGEIKESESPEKTIGFEDRKK
ncbi:MAG TPA: DUF3467 domain-containing protein [bacterium]|nr:DUF3467 domain-containing protein [bacterium]